MKFSVTAATHPDHSDGANQDSVIARQTKTIDGKDALFAVICDGTGQLGQTASASIAKAFDTWFMSFKDTKGAVITQDAIFKTWDMILQKMTKRIFREAGGDTCATVAVFLILDGTWYMTNVGDVRVYEILSEGTKQLSTDHTFAAREIALGHMEPVEAMTDPQAFCVLQTVGKTKDIVASKASGDVEENAVYLICTGGFYRKNRKSFLYQSFRPDTMENGKEENILTKAKENAISGGEKSDITAVVIRMVKEEVE